MAKRPAYPAPRIFAVGLQDQIIEVLARHRYNWPYQVGVGGLHMLSHGVIPNKGIRLTWAIWRLKRRGIVRTEWAYSYKQTMIGLIK